MKNDIITVRRGNLDLFLALMGVPVVFPYKNVFIKNYHLMSSRKLWTITERKNPLKWLNSRSEQAAERVSKAEDGSLR